MSHIRSPISGLLTSSLSLGPRHIRLSASVSCHHRLLPQRRTYFSEGFNGINGVVDSASSLFTSIHGAGVPWYLTIPLVALGINTAIRLPTQLYMQKLDNKRAAVKPLLVAWMTRHAGTPFRGPLAKKPLHVTKQAEKSRRRLYRAWGVQTWKMFIPLTSMLPFVIVSEALRRLSGVSLYTSGAAASTTADASISAAKAAGEVLAQAPITGADASLSTGGCLWFPDLMATDPYLGLPLVCSALLAANIFSRMSAADWHKALLEHRPAETVLQKFARGLLRLSIFVPIFPLCFTYLPTSVFLYWTANFALQLVNVNLVKRILHKKESLLQWKPLEPKIVAYVNRQGNTVQKKQ